MTGLFAPNAFAHDGPLPTSTMVLEASAGTGKTYAIVTLAVRYLAEGHCRVDDLLMATFSNAASTELRDRMRARLRGALAVVTDPTDATAIAADDPLRRLLLAGTPAEVGVRRDRLADALADFDSATIATTHTFCNRMLGALGFLGERQQQYPIVPNVDELVADLSRDLYLARFAGESAAPIGYPTVDRVTRDAVRDGAAILAPTGDDERSDEVDLRLWFAEQARRRTAGRKSLARIRTYDDLQDALLRIVTDDTVGEAACDRIRQRFTVVLIDEFQDTDPQQWEIIRRCFAGLERPLILVGDPKQSIYAFRGAEVLSYLNAVDATPNKTMLTVNWRSDGPLVRGLGAIFADAALGHPAIAVHPVHANRTESRINNGAPIRIRTFVRSDFTAFTTDGIVPLVKGVRARIIDDVADDIAAQLDGSTQIVVNGDSRAVTAGDIAVLLRRNNTIEPLRQALANRGVASVVTSGTSIFDTPAAREWWYVLSAIETPARSTRVRLSALTDVVGESAESLAAGGDALAGRLAGHFTELGRILGESGFPAMTARLLDLFDTAGRVLGGAHGERRMTDLLQVADLCHRHLADTGSGISGLVSWLGEQVAATGGMVGDREATRRLDKDTRAVQIMTVHASKGLEFPLVYVPFGWDGAAPPTTETFVYHDENGRRRLDIGGEHAPGAARRHARARTEDAAEDLRLLYVAATRAASRLVLWWAPSTTTPRGALHRLLFTRAERVAAGRRQQSYAIPDLVPVPSDGESRQVLRELADLAPDITIETAGGDRRSGRRVLVPPTSPVPPLRVSTLDRRIDQGWRRTSYSAIVADAHQRAHAALPAAEGADRDQLGDEPIGDDNLEESSQSRESVPENAIPSPMNGLPFGAAFGTLVHEVLEHVDTGVDDMDAEVRQRCAEGAARRAADIDVETLSSALCAVLTTPLGSGDLRGLTLRAIAPKDRLSELDFDLPLGRLRLSEVAVLLDRHLPPDDLLAGYGSELATVSGDTFYGFLTGSIDSVLRLPDGRLTIVDYKTNRLRPGDLTVADFTPQAMAQEMRAAHYPLQAMLYAVALHRYLRWRQPGYRPDVHLGPIQYHFVRGMAGPQTPDGCGVFEWAIPPGLVVDLSELIEADDEPADSAAAADRRGGSR